MCRTLDTNVGQSCGRWIQSLIIVRFIGTRTPVLVIPDLVVETTVVEVGICLYATECLESAGVYDRIEKREQVLVSSNAI
jgi:hypothetical protein